MKRSSFLGFCLLLSASLGASEDVYQSSLSAARWLDLPYSTRVAALAGLGATGEGVDALSYNPAGLAATPEIQADLSENYWLSDASSQRVGVAFPWGPGGFGAAFDNVNFGAVDQYEVNSQGQVSAQGSLNPDAWALQAGYALSLGDLRLGAALQALDQNLVVEQESGYDLDLGAEYGVGPLRFGLALLGALGDLAGTPVPRDLDVEGNWRAWVSGPSSVNLFAGLDWAISDQEASAALGIEASLNRYCVLRGGYRAAGSEGAGGWALGLGLKPLAWLDLDYAYNDVGALQATNLWTLNLSWNAWWRHDKPEISQASPGAASAATAPLPSKEENVKKLGSPSNP